VSTRFILRLEGTFVCGGAIAGYAVLDASWTLFLILLLAPDLFMIGYLGGLRVGAFLYNLGHTYAGPILLGAAAAILSSALAGAVALIWTAHIGMDRALGFGLKHPTAFQDTHLSPQSPPTPTSSSPLPARRRT
jgi:hypothetical protein